MTPAAAAQARLALLAQNLDASQWFAPPALERNRAVQLAALLQHHAAQCDWVADRLRSIGAAPGQLAASPQSFAQFPVTTRRDVQQAGAAFHARAVPVAHRPVAEKKTSGSTGEPVAVRRTALNHLFWLATTLREHQWHGRDPAGTLAVVRANLVEPFSAPSWGSPVADLFTTGPVFGVPASTDTRALIAWLRQHRPHYLLIYPSIWRAALDHLQGDMRGLESLRQIRTIGETVSDELRRRTREEAGLPLADTYSSEEAGTIAIQCPQGGLYHTMAEGLIVEVLAGDGRACAPGEVGRVVVTDLLNFATPLIRYEIGDHAEACLSCACGRHLPALRKILGRERNMVRLPGGASHWPLTGFHDFAQVAPVLQYQLVQKSLQRIEVRLVVQGGPPTPGQEAALRRIITRALLHPFELSFVYFDSYLPRARSGKFEEFICEI